MSREVKVGMFVLLGLITATVVIFMIGEERGVFSDKQTYTAIFSDVQGLKRGSPVRMGGVRIGSVTAVHYSDDVSDSRPHVELSISEREAVRVRENSQALVASKGLLGDKMIVVTAGSPDKPAIPNGGTLPSEDPEDLGKMLQKVTSLGDKAEGVMSNLEKTTGTLAQDDFRKDLSTGVESLAGILKSMDEGEGYAGRLLNDPAEADKLSRTLGHLERTSASLNRLTRGLNKIVDRVNEGPGFAHEMIYGDAPTKALASFGDAADELALTMRGVREGNGLAHGVLFGGDESAEGTGKIAGDLQGISTDLRQIVANIRAGKGTLGALLVDPSVYEDLKMLLGNVQRNQVLRALVRYSIQRDETKPRVQVVDPAAGKAKKSAAAGAKQSGAKAPRSAPKRPQGKAARPKKP